MATLIFLTLVRKAIRTIYYYDICTPHTLAPPPQKTLFFFLFNPTGDTSKANLPIRILPLGFRNASYVYTSHIPPPPPKKNTIFFISM